MVAISFGRGAGHYIAGEAQFWRTRQHETLAMGQDLKAGTVLGRLTTGGKVTQHTPGATDGSQTPIGFLFDDCNATAEDKRVVVTARDHEVDGKVITWAAGITPTQKTTATTALAALGIVFRP